MVRRTARLLRPQGRRIVVALLMVLVWTGAMLAGPALVRYGIDQGIREDDGGALDRAVVAYLVVSAVSYVAFRAQILLISQAGEEFLRDLRIRLFHHLQRLSMPFYDREKAGVVVSRMTSDVDSLAELVQRKVVDPAEAYMKAVDKEALISTFQHMGIELDPDMVLEPADNAPPAGPPPRISAPTTERTVLNVSGTQPPPALPSQNPSPAAPRKPVSADPLEEFRKKRGH